MGFCWCWCWEWSILPYLPRPRVRRCRNIHSWVFSVENVGIVKQADFVKYLWYFSAHDSVFTYAEHQQKVLSVFLHLPHSNPRCDNPLAFFLCSAPSREFYKTASWCENFSFRKMIAWEIKKVKYSDTDKVTWYEAVEAFSRVHISCTSYRARDGKMWLLNNHHVPYMYNLHDDMVEQKKSEVAMIQFFSAAPRWSSGIGFDEKIPWKYFDISINLHTHTNPLHTELFYHAVNLKVQWLG